MIKANVAIMSKRYTLEIIEDEYGDTFLQLPDELLQEFDWEAGDVLEYSEETDGSLCLFRVSE